MIVLEDRTYYGTPDLQRIYQITSPTIWKWERENRLPKPLKPFGLQSRCLWPVEQIDILLEESTGENAVDSLSIKVTKNGCESYTEEGYI